MTGQKQLKVLILEPSPVIRQGLKVLLEEFPEFVIQSMYNDLQEFHKNRKEGSPDILLINPTIIGFHKEFSIKTLFPEFVQTVFIAILYAYVDTEALNKFDGTLNIYDEGSVMVKKLHTIVKTKHNKEFSNSGDSPDLSEREKEILTSVAKGLTNKEIADKHCISIHTVVSHRKNITRKTGIKTVSGLTIYAIFNNLISQNDLD